MYHEASGAISRAADLGQINNGFWGFDADEESVLCVSQTLTDSLNLLHGFDLWEDQGIKSRQATLQGSDILLQESYRLATRASPTGLKTVDPQGNLVP